MLKAFRQGGGLRGLLQRMYDQSVKATRPLPNPEDYVPPPPLPRLRDVNMSKLLRDTLSIYRSTWATFDERREADRQKWESTVRQQSQALRDVVDEGQRTADMMRQWANVYSESMSQFTKGYKEGAEGGAEVPTAGAQPSGTPDQQADKSRRTD